MQRFPTTIADAERFLWEIAGGIGTSAPLLIPTRATQLGPGSEASVVQLMITWAAHQIRPILHTYAKSEDDEQIQEIVRRQYGVVAAVLCAAAKARPPSIDITKALKSAAFDALRRRLLDTLRREREYETGFVIGASHSARGRAAELICVDHMDVGIVPPFYFVDADGYRNLRDLRGFTQLTNRVFERLVPIYYRRNFSHEFKNAVGAYAFELISNTHDHARTDLTGQELILSVRGLYARHYELTVHEYASMSAGYEPLQEYFHRVFTSNRGERRQLVELSVYDSGPGMAQRWTRRPLDALSPAEELAAVQECFYEGTTTKLHRMFGAGLPLVLALLEQQKGFIRIRTGHTSLYLDVTSGTAAQRVLSRWLLPSNQCLARVAGTLISIFVPIPRGAP